MQLRKRRLAIILAALPLLSSTLALQVDTQDVKSAAKNLQQAAAKALPKFDDVASTTSTVLSTSTRIPIGTKDAPVDGLDGKPHAGPFVDSSSSEKAAGAAVAPPKQTTITKASPKKVDTETGVMNDVNRQAPKKGTTGTEGGVSEKDRLAGAGALKRPEAPKEAPELPASDSARLGLKPADDTKKTVVSDENAAGVDKPRGAAGIEVSSVMTIAKLDCRIED
jgi:hypothetical protein